MNQRGKDSGLIAAAEGVEISVELFPPKGAAASAALFDELDGLGEVNPGWYSVTCGAGGSGNDGTAEVVLAVREHTGLPVAAHLTCSGRTREEVDAAAGAYWDGGVRSILALRGDKPKDAERYEPTPGGYAYASDLIEGLLRLHPFEVSAACYPEAHPEAGSLQAEIDNTKRKVDAGAVRLIGQYCFDTDKVLRFRDRLAAAGVAAPFVPGIMPIRNFRQIKSFSLRCGASIPGWLEARFEGVGETGEAHRAAAIEVAQEQCGRLIGEGIAELHVYCLNRAGLTVELVRRLGLGNDGGEEPERSAA